MSVPARVQHTVFTTVQTMSLQERNKRDGVKLMHQLSGHMGATWVSVSHTGLHHFRHLYSQV